MPFGDLTKELWHWGMQDAHAAHLTRSTIPIRLDSLTLIFLPIKSILTLITASHNILMDKVMKSELDEQSVRQTEK